MKGDGMDLLSMLHTSARPELQWGRPRNKVYHGGEVK